MQYAGKDIKLLTDDELWAAIHNIAGMEKFRFDKLQDPKIKKDKHRLNKIFRNNPPVENEAFTNLAMALNQEFQLRNKTDEIKN